MFITSPGQVTLAISPVEGFCFSSSAGAPLLTGLGLVEALLEAPLCPGCRPRVIPEMERRLQRMWCTPLEERQGLPWHVWMNRVWSGDFILADKHQRVLSDLVLFVADATLDRLAAVEPDLSAKLGRSVKFDSFSSYRYLDGVADAMSDYYASLNCLHGTPASSEPAPMDLSRN